MEKLSEEPNMTKHFFSTKGKVGNKYLYAYGVYHYNGCRVRKMNLFSREISEATFSFLPTLSNLKTFLELDLAVKCYDDDDSDFEVAIQGSERE